MFTAGQMDGLWNCTRQFVNKRMSRRSALGTLGKVAGTAAVLGAPAVARPGTPAKLKGRINHSVCRWCYNKIPLDDLCEAAKDMGIKSIDLLKVDDFATVKK